MTLQPTRRAPVPGMEREPGLAARLRGPALYGTAASLLSILCYGSGQMVSRGLLGGGETPPQTGSTITLFVGMLVLGAVSSRNLPRDLRAPKRALAWIMIAGVLASSGAFLSFFAFSLAPLVVVSPIVAVSPLMTLVLTAIFLRQTERITRRVVLGSFLVIMGVILVILGNQ